MSTPNTYSYDCRQPDPEIWGGGSTTGLLKLTSGPRYSEKIFYNYDLEVTPGSSTIGSAVFSGATISSYLIKNYVGDLPTFSFYNQGIEKIFYVFSTPDQNITLSGSSNYALIRSEVCEQISIDYSGSIIEKITYDYNIDSTEIFTSLDNGFISTITTQTENYGLLIDPLEEHSDFGSTEILFTTTALSGGFVVSNEATYKRIVADTLEIDPIVVSSHGLERVIYNPPLNEKLIQDGDIAISGNGNYFVVYNTPEDTIDLICNVSSTERIGHSYNDNSIGSFESETYFNITDPLTSLLDYGFISLTPTQGNEDFGFTFDDNSTITPFGDIAISGSALVRPPDDIRTYNTGAVYRVTYNPPENTTSLFTFGEKLESVEYNYNIDSIKFVSTESIGILSDSPTNIEDSGLITEIVTQFIDYEGIDVTTTTYPFGLFTLSGSAESEYTNINFYGSLLGAEVKVVYSPDNTSGTLFSFGEKLESIIYDYNENSILVVGDTNYGSVSAGSTIFDNYGFVNEIHNESIDEGFLVGFSASEDVYPFGNISIFGNSQEFSQSQISNTTVLIGLSGISTERVIYIPPTNIKLEYSTPDITISGSSGITPVSYEEVGSGSLFNVGSISETVVYDYNLDSILPLVSDDNGSISEPTTSSIDYGFVNEVYVGEDEYGDVSVSETLPPFGSLLLNGSANTEWINKNFSASGEYKVVYSPDNTSGTLFGFGSELESVTYDYNDYSIIALVLDDNGSISEPTTSSIDYGFVNEVYVGEEDNGSVEVSTAIPFGSLLLNGSANTEWINKNFSASGEYKVVYSPDNTSGTLFSFGEKLESIIYDYNENSILVVGDTNYGSIGIGNTVSDDYGVITDPNGPIIDQGFLVGFSASEDVYPFGEITVLGSSLERNTESYNSLDYGFTLSGYSNIKFAASESETCLFEISGTSGITPFTYSEVGIGTLFSLGNKLESVTYDYNENSIVPFIIEDFESIDSGVTSLDNYGSIGEIINEQVDYGSDAGIIVGFGASEEIYPFGTFVISGTSGNGIRTYDEDVAILFAISGQLGHPNIDYTPSITGIGTVFISGSAQHSFINSDPVTQISTITFSDNVIESRTHSYNEDSIVFDINLSYGLISDSITGAIDDYGLIVESGGETVDIGLVSVGIQTAYPYGTITISGELSHPEIDYTPKYTGSGILSIIGSANYSETDAFGVGRRRGGTIALCGDALYSETDAYVGLGTIVLDREGVVTPGLVSRSRSYVGIETIILSSSALESDLEEFVASGIISISGSALENITAQTPDGTQLFTFSGELNHPDIDYTPHYGIEKNIGIGTTGIQITELSSAIERFSANTPENTQLFQIYGSSIESIGFNPPENNQLFVISGTIQESESESYVGVAGTLTLSDFAVERNTESYVGIGTLQVSGVVDDSAQRVARGVGSISVVNGFSPQESYPWLPEPGVGRSWSFTRSTYIAQGSLSISSGIAQTHYYSPIYPRNSGDPSAGIGTIRVNDDKQLTFYRATLPVFAKGSIYILGIGTAGNGDLDGVEIGANESFTPATEISSGLFTISGISSNREIAVYTAVGLGTIALSVSSIIRDTKSYESNLVIHLGKYEIRSPSLGDNSLTFDSDILTFDNNTSQFVYSEAYVTETDSYNGTGIIGVLNGAAESFSLQSITNTQVFEISGTAEESYSAQTPETEVLYQFSGNITEYRTYGYEGSGSASFASAAGLKFAPNVLSIGLLRFTTYLSDNVYDTCDSLDITSDLQNSAHISFTSNPPEDTSLYVISGNSDTSETSLYTEIVSGFYTLSGTYSDIKFTTSESGIGTIYITETSLEGQRDSYIGSGTLFTVSGASEYYSAQTPESTILLEISGSAVTSVESDYPTVGIGLFAFNGFANILKITSYVEVGTGGITLSGELVHPDIIFIPSLGGSGSINILGSSNESLTKIYDDTSGTLFHLSSGLESFTRSAYTGIGSIYIQELSGTTIINPYQIPRTYVCII